MLKIIISILIVNCVTHICVINWNCVCTCVWLCRQECSDEWIYISHQDEPWACNNVWKCSARHDDDHVRDIVDGYELKWRQSTRWLQWQLTFIFLLNLFVYFDMTVTRTLMCFTDPCFCAVHEIGLRFHSRTLLQLKIIVLFGKSQRTCSLCAEI